MKRFFMFTGGILIALTVAACGGAVSSGGGGAPAKQAIVKTMSVNGFGSVLTNASGLALYTNNRDTAAMPQCNGACAVVWKPLTVQKSASLGTISGGKLGTVKRSNGSMQVTFNGKPVYTFKPDQKGTVTGDGATDSFSGQNFTWHVVRLGGAGGSSGGTSPAPSSGGQSGGGTTPGY